MKAKLLIVFQLLCMILIVGFMTVIVTYIGKQIGVPRGLSFVLSFTLNFIGLQMALRSWQRHMNAKWLEEQTQKHER